MDNKQQYVTSSLELHLFFARIMKEHAIFLEAGFMAKDVEFIQEADHFKMQFERLLFHTVRLSQSLVRPCILQSGEIITDYTLDAEKQTQQLTGITIDQSITAMQASMCAITSPVISPELLNQVNQLNAIACKLLDGLIALKERILADVLCCKLFTANYPTLIKHILREAQMYRANLKMIESGNAIVCQNKQQTFSFWNQIMMEHALFIRGLLDPSENTLIESADTFADNYYALLAKSQAMTNATTTSLGNEILCETIKFKDFKTAGAKGIQECKIRSIILPLLADHVLREANHYLRLLYS